MKVILLEDVPNLGKKNDLVEVNDGYAKNFLFKKKLAVANTQTSVQRLNKDLEHEQELYQEGVYEAELLKKKLESLTPTFYLNSDHHGNAFGEVSAKHFLDEINKDEKLITKYMLQAKGWGLGPHQVKVQVHKDVVATIKINVLEKK